MNCKNFETLQRNNRRSRWSKFCITCVSKNSFIIARTAINISEWNNRFSSLRKSNGIYRIIFVFIFKIFFSSSMLVLKLISSSNSKYWFSFIPSLSFISIIVISNISLKYFLLSFKSSIVWSSSFDLLLYICRF